MPAAFSRKSIATGPSDVSRRYPTNAASEIGSEQASVEQEGNVCLGDNRGESPCLWFKYEAEFIIGPTTTISHRDIGYEAQCVDKVLGWP